MQNKNLNKFFNPESIAIVGATDGEGKVGRVVTENILNLGYKEEVFLVNPNRKELFGRKCYTALESIKDNVDLAIVIVPAKFVNDVVKNGSDKTKNFVIISAGFSEIGGEGKKREEELAQLAREKNLNILGPNCLGFIIPKLKLNATFSGGMPGFGNIGFITQSGALAVAILDIFEREHLGFSGVFSIGNKVRIDETDLIEYLGNDPGTKVIGLYLEGIKNGSRFMEVAERVSRVKPIVILKAGKTEKSQKAIFSHTGALAGSDNIIDAVFEKCSIIRADNLEKFINILRLISLAKVPQNNLVAVVTNAGGAGVLTTDVFKDKIITLAELSEATKSKLRSVLPEESSVENPVDVLGDSQEDRYESVLDILNGENIGSILCILTPQQQTPVDKIADKIISFSETTHKVVMADFMGGEKIKSAEENLQRNSIPNFSFPDEAVEALDKYCRWNIFRSGKEKEKFTVNQERRKRVETLIQKVKAEERSALLFSEAEELMRIYGISVIETYDYNSNMNLKFPLVAKIDSDKILHKTEKQGVIIDIKDKGELDRAVAKLRSYFPEGNIIIQPMSEGHKELIIGIKRDVVFGPVIVYGLGGIYTEVFQMVDFLMPPFDVQEAEKALLKSKIRFLFKETRGKKSCSSRELAKILEAVGLLARENPEILELDINPLFVYNDGNKAIAADIKVII